VSSTQQSPPAFLTSSGDLTLAPPRGRATASAYGPRQQPQSLLQQQDLSLSSSPSNTTGDEQVDDIAASADADPTLSPPPPPQIRIPGYGDKTPYFNEPERLDRDQAPSALDDFPLVPAFGYRLAGNVQVGMASLNAVAVGANWQLGPNFSLVACFTRGVGVTAPELRRSINREVGTEILSETERSFERPSETTVGIGLDLRF
jgi:hypothetical protein